MIYTPDLPKPEHSLPLTQLVGGLGYHCRLGRGTGIPSVHWFGTESGFNAMVIGRLGLSLDQLFVW